ncbi:hypothetical protein CEXT_448201 [Caerostris extrusa]|nr:hypothetical protein CEXT_448201 [Caerostris extrusa]
MPRPEIDAPWKMYGDVILTINQRDGAVCPMRLVSNFIQEDPLMNLGSPQKSGFDAFRFKNVKIEDDRFRPLGQGKEFKVF